MACSVSISSAFWRTRVDSSRRMRITSAFSSAVKFSNWLSRLMIFKGSTKAVSPVLETSCTTPGIWVLESIRTGMTQRPDRWVIKSSCKNEATRGSRTTSSNFLRIWASSCRISLRNSASNGEAWSRTFPS